MCEYPNQKAKTEDQGAPVVGDMDEAMNTNKEDGAIQSLPAPLESPSYQTIHTKYKSHLISKAAKYSQTESL